jgi:hypothetical protein
LDAANPTSFKYSDTVTYEKGFNWLKCCQVIEDWGCGAGGFKRFFTNVKNQYIGIDGSITPFSNVKADLVTYKSNVPGIYMRHILEHNYEWRKVLENALQSFTERFCLVLFTPFTDATKEIAHNLPHGVDVPDIAFSKDEITKIISDNGCVFTLESFGTDTGYGVEHIFYINLEHRKDRRDQIEHELEIMSLKQNSERFEAIHKKPGIVGCGYSHLAVLKLAKERNYENVLILEDDVILRDDFGIQIEKVYRKINFLTEGYLIFLSGRDTRVSKEFLMSNDILFKIL